MSKEDRKKYKITVLPGDGIGPEVIAVGVAVLKALEKLALVEFEFQEALIGGAAYDAIGLALPPTTIRLCKQADAVLMGPVGGPRWDNLELDQKPEKALIDLRKSLDCYVNLRPVDLVPWNQKNSPLNYQVLSKGFSLTIIRELSSGMYTGDKGRRGILGTDSEIAYDVETYEASVIRRIAKFTFNLARKEGLKVTNIDKANLLESAKLWREIINRTSLDYPEVVLENLYVDHAFTRLMKKPDSFDLILCNNVFGDVASDIASGLIGSYAVLPSASLSALGGPSLFEAVHGTAPDLAGLNKANPLGIILSIVLLLEYGLKEKELAYLLKKVIYQTLSLGYRTFDFLTEEDILIWQNSNMKEKKKLPFKLVGTKEMGEVIIKNINKMKKFYSSVKIV